MAIRYERGHSHKRGRGHMRWMMCGGLLLALGGLGLPIQFSHAATPKAGCVVLIHGLAGSRLNWIGLPQLLQRSGYHVVNYSYPSRQQRIEVAAQALAPVVQQCSQRSQQRLPVHLVGHSMGGW